MKLDKEFFYGIIIIMHAQCETNLEKSNNSKVNYKIIIHFRKNSKMKSIGILF